MSNHVEHDNIQCCLDVCDTFETQLSIMWELRISSGKPGRLKSHQNIHVKWLKQRPAIRHDWIYNVVVLWHCAYNTNIRTIYVYYVFMCMFMSSWWKLTTNETNVSLIAVCRYYFWPRGCRLTRRYLVHTNDNGYTHILWLDSHNNECLLCSFITWVYF